MKDKIGVVGIGNIGFGISCNLLKSGFKVIVYDIRSEPLAKIRKRGAAKALSISELAEQCQLVFSSLLDYKQNLSVLAGPEGLLQNMKQGGYIFVCSTISPSEARELSKIAEEHSIKLLDCPVSGGPEGANAGTLSLMIGGDREAIVKNRKALKAISKNIYHFGDVGAGESAKAINQLLISVNNLATAEAMLLVSKCGLDRKKVFDLITNSTGDSWIFRNRAMRMIEGDFEPRGILGILLKDTSIVTNAAESYGLVLPTVTLARQLYQAGVNLGFGDEDDSAILKVLEKLSNYSVS